MHQDKNILVLLNNPIENDFRVIKTIRTISKVATIHLIYIQGANDDKHLFNDRVYLYPQMEDLGFKTKFIKHTFFCREFIFFKKIALQLNIAFDSVWANDLPTLLPAFQIAKQLNAKLIYDSHEIYLETINQFFPLKDTSFFKRIVYKSLITIMKWHGLAIEKKIIQHVNLFITVNNSILDYFNTKYQVKNGISIMNFPYIDDSNKAIHVELNPDFLDFIEDKKVILYQGILNEGRGLKLLIKTLSLLDNSFVLVVIGKGVLKKELMQIVHNLNIQSKVFFQDFVSTNIIKYYTQKASIGVNLLEDINLSKKMASPNKLFEYIQSSVPVVASNTTENKRVLEQFNVGILTDNTEEELMKALYKLSSIPRSEFEFENAKKIYTWEYQESKLLENLPL